MRIYFVSLGAGILVGIIYGLMSVRSPAPPAVALIGLLGMLVGEQVVPLASKLVKGESITAAWFSNECIPKITGAPNKGPAAESAVAENKVDSQR